MVHYKPLHVEVKQNTILLIMHTTVKLKSCKRFSTEIYHKPLSSMFGALFIENLLLNFNVTSGENKSQTLLLLAINCFSMDFGT